MRERVLELFLRYHVLWHSLLESMQEHESAAWLPRLVDEGLIRRITPPHLPATVSGEPYYALTDEGAAAATGLCGASRDETRGRVLDPTKESALRKWIGLGLITGAGLCSARPFASLKERERLGIARNAFRCRVLLYHTHSQQLLLYSHKRDTITDASMAHFVRERADDLQILRWNSLVRDLAILIGTDRPAKECDRLQQILSNQPGRLGHSLPTRVESTFF